MADFRTAVNLTMDKDHEGGFQNLRNDKGNWTGGAVGVGELKGTKYGISAAQFPNLDIANLTTDQAAAIYKEGYWKTLYSQINSQLLANKLFDIGVLMGVGTAVKLLQITIKNDIMIVPDGVFGEQTLTDVNQEGDDLLGKYRTVLINHAINIVNENPNDSGFIQDWLRRINS